MEQDKPLSNHSLTTRFLFFFFFLFLFPFFPFFPFLFPFKPYLVFIIFSIFELQVGFKNQTGVQKRLLTQEEALILIKDAFTGATERDIYTGDFLEYAVITKQGVQIHRIDLKKD